jgi:hypothetical protein
MYSSYEWYVNCTNTTQTGSSDVMSFLLQREFIFTNIAEEYPSPDSYGYTKSRIYNVTLTWESEYENVSTVIFNFNGTNYTVTANRSIDLDSAEFYYNLTDSLIVGNYTYYWFASGAAQLNSTSTQAYEVQKASPAVFMTLVSSNGWSIYSGSSTVITGNDTNEGDDGCSYTLHYENIPVVNPYAVSPSSTGLYSVIFNTTGCFNYTSGQKSNTLVVTTNPGTTPPGGGGSSSSSGYCGDGICSTGESLLACPVDCATDVQFRVSPSAISHFFTVGTTYVDTVYIENMNDYEMNIRTVVNCNDEDPSCEWVRLEGSGKIPPQSIGTIDIVVEVSESAEEVNYAFSVSFAFGDSAKTTTYSIISNYFTGLLTSVTDFMAEYYLISIAIVIVIMIVVLVLTFRPVKVKVLGG